MDSLIQSPDDIISNLAPYLTPRDVSNLLLSSKRLHIMMHNETKYLPSYFMERSLRHSLMSVLRHRDGFHDIAEPLIDGIGDISILYGEDQLGIAGSLIVEAITTGSGSGFGSAGDIDMYGTHVVLEPTRFLLAKLGFVLTKVTTTRYSYVNASIHHVESYSIPSDFECPTTIEDYIKNIPSARMKRFMKKRWDFLINKDSPYAIDPKLPLFLPGSTAKKEIDLVVTSATTVLDTIYNFDIVPCMSWFNGHDFFVPDLLQIFRGRAKMRCSNWAALINAYVSMFLATFPFDSFTQICPFSPPIMQVDFIFQCLASVRSQGVLLPDKDGDFPSSDTPTLTGRYCITLHNMLVKQAWRILKYNQRGFYFVDIHVPELNPRKGEAAKEDAVTGSGSISQYPATKPKRQMDNNDDPVRRVKLLHNYNISSPIRRAKLRHLDDGGINTSPYFNL